MSIAIRPHETESGAIIPFFALALVSVLGVMGLAIDAGMVYRAQLTLQKACDGAALAAASTLLEPLPSEPNAILTAQQTVRDNLSLEKINPSTLLSGFPDVNIDMAQGIIRVRARLRLPLTFISVIPGLGHFQNVAASSQVLQSDAIVAMMLDTSGSMNCAIGSDTPTAGNQSCTCMPNCPVGTGVDTQKRTVLKEAVLQGFLPYFTDGRDRISLVTYNRSAKILMPATSNLTMLQTMIMADSASVLDSFDLTNHSDAVIAGYHSVKAQLTANPKLSAAYVIMTDGAPTAARFNFADPKTAVVTSLLNDGGIGADAPGLPVYDYYVWDVVWQYLNALTSGGVQIGDLPTIVQSMRGETAHGISTLAPSPVDETYFEPIPQPGTEPPCSVLSYPGLPAVAGGQPPDDNGQSELGGCLNSLKFRDLGGNIWPTGAATIPSFRQQYYHSTIANADWTRARRGVWYSIALGPAHKQPASPAAPDLVYEDPLNLNTRKGNFMRRVALDPAAIAGTVPYADFDIAGMTPITTLASNPDHAHGVYFGVSPGDELSDIFRSVAKLIKLRLVQFQAPTP